MKKIKNWFKFHFRRHNQTVNYKKVKEAPSRLKENLVYLVINDSYCWEAVMLCPCGCKVKLHLNMVEEQQPYWNWRINRKKNISIHPSIHRWEGCKSHFFIRNGKVDWVGFTNEG